MDEKKFLRGSISWHTPNQDRAVNEIDFRRPICNSAIAFMYDKNIIHLDLLTKGVLARIETLDL